MSQRVPSSNIDQLLSGLKAATGALRESIKEGRHMKAAPKLPPAMTTRQEIVDALMHEVERRYGIAPGDQVERKLLRIFDLMSFSDLERWSMALLSPNALEAEWLSLVECLTIHETYFDRDKEQMAILQSEILPPLIERKHQSGDYRLRIWSAGCSSGEETYNLAMLLLMAMKESGFALERPDGSIIAIPAWDVSVLGSDISSQMIRIAKSACYTTGEMSSFRDMNPTLWRFFEKLPPAENEPGGEQTMRVKPCVTGITRFQRHNLLDPLIESAPFDIIVCRNVLIYFDKNKGMVQGFLCGNLTKGGALMLGATDLMINPHDLQRNQRNGSFWYLKS